MFKNVRYSIVWSIFLFAIVFSVLFISSSNKASASYEAGEYVWFRIDSELNTLIADKGTLTIRWYCTGATTYGEVNDGTASESTNSADGIIKVASNSAEMTNASCTIGASETLRASASIDGWVVRTWTAASFPGASTSDPFTTGASLDYNFVAGLVKDELAGALVLNGTTASASYSGTTASSSYSGGYKYIAATADGTLTGGADGYVNKTLSVSWAGTGTDTRTLASKSADFNSATSSTYNGTPLPFGVKANLDKNDRSGKTYSNITGATVTAGTALGVSCTDNSDGDYYCAVPLAGTAVLASAASIPVGGQSENITCTYTDRTTGGDAQSTCTITANEPAAGGGGGGNIVAVATPTPSPTPTPSATPTPSVTPTPTVSVTPTPSVFPVAVKLYRKVSDPKVYVLANDGTLTWVKTLADFNAAGYRWADVKVISGPEFAKLGVKSTLGVKKGVTLNIRKTASTTAKIIGKMKLNDSYEKTGQSGVWYKINFNGQDGWVHSSYTVNK